MLSSEEGTPMMSIPEDLMERKMDLTPDAMTILESRYLLRNKEGAIIETPEQMCARVAMEAAKAGAKYEGCAEDAEQRFKRFYYMLLDGQFSPNSPTWMNAGTPNPQNAACFVLPVEDSLSKIFDAVKNAALIHQSGGGTGFDFSSLRPAGDVVRSTGGVASGPVSFMAVFNSATETIKQGGKRRGANIGILRVDHPDIESFITCKEDNNTLVNFNISVALTDLFMKAVEEGTEYEILNPRDGKPAGKKDARAIFHRLVEHAWKNGEPGIVFLDRINSDNPTPKLGRISATNPCGEQPLLPYEACNLGSVNLQKVFKEAASDSDVLSKDYLPEGLAEACEAEIMPEIRKVDWALLSEVVRNAVDFLDSIIDVSEYPIKEISERVRTTRKVGLGMMGFADLLILLGLPYGSVKSELMAKLISNFITGEARIESARLAAERGPFPAFEGSTFDIPGKPAMRNATVTTIAPTGTISMIANASSGCEPLFGVAFTKQNVLGGKQLTQTNPIFFEDLKKRGLLSDELTAKVADNGGSVQGIDEIPDDMKELYRTALEIPWEWHVKIQAAIQSGTENAVSKTINMMNDASPEDVSEAYMLAYRLGCKGLTVYRSGSREIEVISSKQKKHARDEEAHKPYTVPCSLWGMVKPIDRPEELAGITKRVATPSGTLWATLNMYEDRPFEIFCQISRAGTDIYAFTESIARLISLCLRAGVDPSEIVKQLRGIGGSGHTGFGPNKVLSVPDAIGRMLEQVMGRRFSYPPGLDPKVPLQVKEPTASEPVLTQEAELQDYPSGAPLPSNHVHQPQEGPDYADQPSFDFNGQGNGSHEREGAMQAVPAEAAEEKAAPRMDLCPSCGNNSLVYESGCETCIICGYSRC